MISERQAYLAMFCFPERYWERGGRTSEELADILGSIHPTSDGRTGDPAAWADWMECIDDAVSRRVVAPSGWCDWSHHSPEIAQCLQGALEGGGGAAYAYQLRQTGAQPFRTSLLRGSVGHELFP